VSEYTFDYFSVTTAEDQSNYFSGDIHKPLKAFEGEYPHLKPGIYRIIEGQLNLIVTGLSPDEVRSQLDIVKQ
jgi:hypothetical protein